MIEGQIWSGLGRSFCFLSGGALFIGAVLRFAGGTLARGSTLFGFHHVLPQFTVAAEKTTVVDYELRLLAFFICHISPG